MYYEVYVDSIFLMNFVMNFYLLLLVNHSTLRTASWKHLVLGAAVGAGTYVLPYVAGSCKGWLFGVCTVVGTVVMILTTFRIKGIRAFLWIVEKMLIYSFLLGGTFFFVIRYVPVARQLTEGIFGIMGMGAPICVAIYYHREREERKRNDSLCRATLIRKCGCMRVTALVDSGNTLIEPISGKPVCIVEQSVFDSLWREENVPFRVIPYHSIGKEKGLLKGYVLSELQLEMGGMIKSFQNVYVAVCQEKISDGINVLVNPMILKKS
ncbi:MAG: hypothetical protein E7287_08020 [Lachnospiraceae bacterium]|nr:hypothetical protein [Lachnospiraceae bacterium]